MRVAANRDVCIGAGLCMLNAPAVFDQDDDGIVVVLTEDVPPEVRCPRIGDVRPAATSLSLAFIRTQMRAACHSVHEY